MNCITRCGILTLGAGRPRQKGKEKCPESSWRFKLNKAKEKGAVAVLFITENYTSNYEKVEHKIEHPGVSLQKKEEPIPFVYISK